MAAAAAVDVAVLVEQFAKRAGPADIGLDPGHPRRRRLGGWPRMRSHHPHAADDGRGVRAVGGDLSTAPCVKLPAAEAAGGSLTGQVQAGCTPSTP